MNSDAMGPRIDRRRARTRAALLQAGEALFAARSVDAVSIDDIVLAADVAKGSFYNHFPDKEALARDVAGLVRAEAEAEVDEANAGVVDPAVRMARAQAVFIRFGVERPDRARAMMRLFGGAVLPEAPLNRGVRADVEAGLAAGRFRGLTVEGGVLLAMGAAGVAVSRVLEANAPCDAAALSAELGFALLRGLGVAEDEARNLAAAAATDIFQEPSS